MGTKIGIGAGIGGTILLVLAGIAILFCVRKSRGKQAQQQDFSRSHTHGQHARYNRAELPEQSQGYRESQEVAMKSGYENSGDNIVYSELGINQRVTEMP
jgi:hypothetical protein